MHTITARPLTPHALRITHSSGTVPPDRPWLAELLLPQPEPGDCAVTVAAQANGTWTVARSDGTPLLHGQRSRLGEQQVAVTFTTSADEGFYGLGQWFNAFRRDQGRVELTSRESQQHNQHKQTYSTIPLLLSSRGYGLFLLNGHTSHWSFDAARRTLTISAAGPPLEYVIFAGPTLAAVIEQYTQLTGRPPLVPRWAFGLWVTGYPQEPQPVVEARVAEHRRRTIPLDGVILDYHWEQGFHTFQWRKRLFPDPVGMIRRLRARGVRLGLIFTPFLNRTNTWFWRTVLHAWLRNVSPGEFRADDRARALYDEAKAKGYLAHPNVWWWLGRGGMLDWTNPAAVDWWNTLMRPRYNEGVVLFKNDDGEYLPNTATSALGIAGREHHNMYGFFYGRGVYDGMRNIDDRRPLIYARSAWAGSQRYPALFLGDQKPTFAHIKATMRAGLNMSLLGFGYWTPDVWGLDGQTTEETHMRYAQWALLAPVARYFWRPPQVDNTRLPWSHSPRAEANFRTLTTLRYRLLPTWCALAWQAHRTGMPLVRPLLLHYSDDARFADCADQYLLGDGLLIAPVTEANATARTITLPAGTWHDWWSTASYDGSTAISYPAALDCLPVLARGESITLLGPALQHIPDNHQFAQIEARCWPPYNAHATLWDDDGRTRAYERGEYSQTDVTISTVGGRVGVRIGAARGDFPQQVAERSWAIVLERCHAPSSVTIDGEDALWRYDPATRALWIDVRCAVDQTRGVIISWDV